MAPATTRRWPWFDKLRSGLHRRVRWLRWRLVGDAPTPFEVAFAWLFGPETVDWVPAMVGDRQGCPATTRAAIAVAIDYGMIDRAGRWQQWLDSLPTENVHAAQRPSQRGPSKGRSARAAVDRLAAALLQVRTSFDQDRADLPDEIDPADGRVQAVLQWAGQLPPDGKLADVGCGKGRFLRHVAAAFPRMRLLGIDPSAAMLARLPAGVEARQGGLLRIPASDAEFDAVLAVESLEHALVPGRAVEELCRAVRPGGRVLVIDKHRGKQALSEHEPWERWFWPEELGAWLGRFCEEVRVERVSHLEGRPGRDLFLAARGRRLPNR